MLARFDAFEVDTDTWELRKDARRLKLQDKPLLILAALLEEPGRIVPRVELKRRLWPEDSSVDFDRGLGTAMGKLRAALGDSATAPKFIETVPRRGFRFIAPVEVVTPEATVTATDSASQRRPRTLRGVLLLIVIAVLVAVALTLFESRNEKPFDSIAVLPLLNHAKVPEVERRADALTEAIIHRLGQIPPLRVVSRTSVMQYKNDPVPLAVIAEELAVDVVVEGSVAETNNGRVQVAVRLVHAATDRSLWAHTFVGEPGQPYALREEVASAVAREVERLLEGETLRR